jgi:microcystin-dependent protein
MRRIDHASAVSREYFAGNPSTGQLPTVVTAVWLNAVQRVLVKMREAAGIPEPADWDTVSWIDQLTQFLAPAGGGMEFYGSTLPYGYLLCDGSAVSRTTYARLFAAIGVAHGAGDGTTTFNLPDRRGLMAIGLVGSSGRVTSASTNGANANTVGGVGGAEVNTLTTGQLPVTTIRDNLVAGGSTLENAIAGDNFDINNRTIGSGQAQNNMPPWMALKILIRY